MNSPNPVAPPEPLTDWACIDLIARNRRRVTARVEEYLAKFPSLRDVVSTLDLIDAEICIRKELGETLDDAEWGKRFPQLENQIRQLLRLDEPPSTRPKQSSLECSQCSGIEPAIDAVFEAGLPSDSATVAGINRSVDDSFEISELADRVNEPLTPIALPPGFIGDTLVAKSPGHWLVRCHDSQDGRHYAFKVTQTSELGVARLTPDQRTDLLNACERTVRVQHPVWVSPVVATCDEQSLGIVRPWVHGTGWANSMTSCSDSQALRMIAEVAFCLHVAHNAGTCHGHVCETNLFIDHSGKLLLTDALVSAALSRSVAEIQCDDEVAVLKLLAALPLDPERDLPLDLIPHSRRVLDSVPRDRLALLGEWLIRIADTGRLAPQARSLGGLVAGVAAAGMGFMKSFRIRRSDDNHASLPHHPR